MTPQLSQRDPLGSSCIGAGYYAYWHEAERVVPVIGNPTLTRRNCTHGLRRV
ncbi:hypothetical protein MN186_13365 [Aliiroseovarius sp. N1F302]|uniref:hypothetical protein n=1 Tax=Aliiroseovarius sediminis TaxID=2925839 RepID=UPI001F55EF0E|nr:hypothetical protein [Aliiroseovarius sediminis]MCI2395441.1 hypothetical protein [Aliiroseovarius sediminis]